MFKPTIFYIKRHSLTGLKYFGKTTRLTVTNGRYRGGGKYWQKHINKHGVRLVETIWKSEVYTDMAVNVIYRYHFDNCKVIKQGELL